ncbi:hypothetical protein DWB84_14430 [Saccharophagus sp. K07]|jgi:hypothetical protein|uniref:hypothetical protein n=1 Tax=Saccharophagus sp. K07 TaxID=2283636 RepID=UPI0016524829|nr:hypothetical protein [Saccharophagus sp. K07]MBC6906646.1 hypothetical protein [Saccharophagus sp. K07]
MIGGYFAHHQMNALRGQTMELAASQLYADKAWVEVGMELTSAEKKQLLEAALEYAESFAIDDLKCSLENTSSGGLFRWGGNKALVLSCPLGKYKFSGIITLYNGKSACVISSYKLLLGDDIFSVNQSAEVRRRALVDRLRNPELIDCFFMLDKTTDLVAEFLQKSSRYITSATEA